MMRRLIISYALVFLADYAFFAIIIHLLTACVYTIYMIKSKPLVGKDNNNFEIMNEIFVCVGAYFLILYTNDYYDIDAKMNIGWFYIGF